MLTTNAPQWSLEAEQFVLGALLLDSNCFAATQPLEAAAFFDGRHRSIFASICRIVAERKVADVLSVHEDLADHDSECGGLAYLNSLAGSVPGCSNVGSYAQAVRGLAQQRELSAIAYRAQDIAAERGDAAEKVSRIVALFSALQTQTTKRVPQPIAELALARTGHYESLQRGDIEPGMKTRIPTLDDALNGGFRAGNLYILAARPSVGKSSFSQQLAMNLARDGRPVLFLSQEMSAEEVADRSVSNAGRLSYSRILTGNMNGEDWTRAAEALEQLGRLPFHVDDQPALTLLDIRTKVQQCRGAKFVVLDYLQLCASNGKSGSRNNEIEEITRGLKALAKEAGVAILALSQLNRQVETRSSKKPVMSDLRDSGGIEQDADVVMFLWPVREFTDRKILGCGIEKNRQGKTCEFGLDFFGDIQRWGESTADIRQESRPKQASKGFDVDE